MIGRSAHPALGTSCILNFCRKRRAGRSYCQLNCKSDSATRKQSDWTATVQKHGHPVDLRLAAGAYSIPSYSRSRPESTPIFAGHGLKLRLASRADESWSEGVCGPGGRRVASITLGRALLRSQGGHKPYFAMWIQAQVLRGQDASEAVSRTDFVDGAGRGSRTPKTGWSADFEWPARLKRAKVT